MHEYRRAEFEQLCRTRASRACRCSASSTPRKLRAHELALRLGWDRVHARLGLTERFYDRFTPAIASADFALRPAGARRTSTARWTSSRCAARERAARERGALAIVLHTHMPYVEGFGTWPFGEEWLWEAIAGCYLPLLDLLDERRAADAVADAGAVRPAGGARASPSASQRFVEEVRRETHERDAAGLRAGGQRGAGAPSSSAPGATTSGRWSACGRAAATCSAALAPHAQWTSSATHAILPLLATDAGVQAAGAERRSPRTAGASADTGRGGFWLPECAYAPWLERALRGRRRAARCASS